MSTMSEVKIEEVALTEIEVCEELRRIDPSKASGPDEIPGRLLIQSTHCIFQSSPEGSWVFNQVLGDVFKMIPVIFSCEVANCITNNSIPSKISI